MIKSLDVPEIDSLEFSEATFFLTFKLIKVKYISDPGMSSLKTSKNVD